MKNTVKTLAKISKYQAEINRFMNKYNTSFDIFEKQLLQQKNEENFEKEDDYLDWKFSEEAFRIWEKRNEILGNA
ncbi:MAG: hypothetical protein ACE5IR_07975 [bacterium]